MTPRQTPVEPALRPDDLLDRRSAGEYLGGRGTPISVGTLARWACEKTGPPYVKLGGQKVRYRVRDLDAWLEERTINPKTAA